MVQKCNIFAFLCCKNSPGQVPVIAPNMEFKRPAASSKKSDGLNADAQVFIPGNQSTATFDAYNTYIVVLGRALLPPPGFPPQFPSNGKTIREMAAVAKKAAEAHARIAAQVMIQNNSIDNTIFDGGLFG